MQATRVIPMTTRPSSRLPAMEGSPYPPAASPSLNLPLMHFRYRSVILAFGFTYTSLNSVTAVSSIEFPEYLLDFFIS